VSLLSSLMISSDLLDRYAIYCKLLLSVGDVLDIWASIEGMCVLFAESATCPDISLSSINIYVVFNVLVPFFV